MINKTTVVLGGAGFILLLLFAVLSVGGVLIPYIVEMWSSLSEKTLYLSWWLGVGIQLACAWFISRKTLWIVIGLALITWFCELGGVFV